jgi:hypothetical protein
MRVTLPGDTEQGCRGSGRPAQRLSMLVPNQPGSTPSAVMVAAAHVRERWPGQSLIAMDGHRPLGLARQQCLSAAFPVARRYFRAPA